MAAAEMLLLRNNSDAEKLNAWTNYPGGTGRQGTAKNLMVKKVQGFFSFGGTSKF